MQHQVLSGQPPLIVGVSGASGAQLADALIGALLRYTQLDLVVVLSQVAARVRALECPDRALPTHTRIRYFDNEDLAAPYASGSWPTAGMVVAPCSMASLAKISHGIADSLLTRAADVTIKEGRKLILMPRESPLSPLHLENMLRLARLGVVIAPPILTLYHGQYALEQQLRELALHAIELLGYPVPRSRWADSDDVAE